MNKKHGGLIGLGLMFMWCCSMLYWVSSHGEIVGLIGSVITSMSGIASFIYIDSVETELKRIEHKTKEAFDQAEYWQDKAQTSIKIIDNKM